MSEASHLARRPGRLAAVAGLFAVAAIVAASLAGRAQVVEPLPPFDAIPFSATVAFPSALAAATAGRLFGWLLAMGWIVFTVGAITVAAVWAEAAWSLLPEIRVHRAVGASRRSLARALVGVGTVAVVTAVGAGLLIGSGAAGLAGRPWPAGPFSLPQLALALAIGAAVLFAGLLFPLSRLRERRIREAEPLPPPLGIAAGQLGLALAFLIGGTMLRSQTAGADRSTASLPTGAMVSQLPTGPDARIPERTAVLRAAMAEQAPGTLASVTNPGGHLGIGPVDALMTDCGRCFVGGVFLRWRTLRAGYLTATADTFAARGASLVAGRLFNDGDGPDTDRVAIVNEHLGRRYFEGGDPVGRTIYPGGRMGGPGYRVVGMVRDPLPEGLAASGLPRETLYLSSLQHPGTTMELLTVGRTASPTAGVPGAELIRRARAPLSWFGDWFLFLGVLGLILGTGGTAVLMRSWARAMRTELGIRRAVGATARSVIFLVLARAAATGARGVVIGVVFVGPVLWPEIGRMAPGTTLWRPGLIAATAAGLVLVAVAAALGPAIAARRLTPAGLWRT